MVFLLCRVDTSYGLPGIMPPMTPCVTSDDDCLVPIFAGMLILSMSGESPLLSVFVGVRSPFFDPFFN